MRDDGDSDDDCSRGDDDCEGEGCGDDVRGKRSNQRKGMCFRPQSYIPLNAIEAQVADVTDGEVGMSGRAEGRDKPRLTR